jgi:DNA modification methylase
MNSKKVKISEVKANPNNPRVIKDDKFAKLVQSIKDFPKMLEIRPIVVNSDMIVLGGNMRLRACKEAGLKEVPIIMAEDLTDEQQKEFIIKDNVSGGEWDWSMLANEWDSEDLDKWGLDVPIFEVAPEAEEDDFDVPEGGIETDIVLGDLFEIGEHRLLCGDSTDADAVARLMNGQKAELLFTSPPYSDMREYNGDKDLSVNNLVEFITSFYEYCEYQVINLGIQRKDNDINEYWNEYINKARDNGYKFLSWNVWAKPSAGSIGNQSAFFPIAHEWIFVFGKKFKDINRTCERTTAIKKDRTHRKVRQADGSMKNSTVGFQGDLKEMESVFYSNPELGDIRSLHPATFPIELPSEYIKAITNERDLICEPFTGSGTTMVASHQLKRKCYGMELDPKYCQVILDRMQKLDPSLEIKRNGVKYQKTED